MKFQTSDSHAVEDPKQLEKVILNMVTTLPSANEINSPRVSPSRGESPHRLALIPPKKERIVSAIEKIYTVIKTIPKKPDEDLKSVIEKVQAVTTVLEETSQISYEVTTEAMTPPYSDTSNLPSFNAFFHAQGSEAEHSETYSPLTSPDFNSTITNSRNEISFPLNEVGTTQPAIEFEVLSPAMNECNGIMANMLSGLNNTAGVKRPRYEDQGETSKKKTAVKTNAANEQATGRDTPTLEMFFDEEGMYE